MLLVSVLGRYADIAVQKSPLTPESCDLRVCTMQDSVSAAVTSNYNSKTSLKLCV